jgi:hypothetical protein
MTYLKSLSTLSKGGNSGLGFAIAGFAAGGFSAPVTVDDRPVIVIARMSNVLDIFDFKSFISRSPKSKQKI